MVYFIRFTFVLAESLADLGLSKLRMIATLRAKPDSSGIATPAALTYVM